jgi:hypothetical protein
LVADAAVSTLRVFTNQPNDHTAKRMLDALLPAEQPSATLVATPASSEPPQTDLTGHWRATAGNTTIEWKFALGGAPQSDSRLTFARVN